MVNVQEGLQEGPFKNYSRFSWLLNNTVSECVPTYHSELFNEVLLIFSVVSETKRQPKFLSEFVIPRDAVTCTTGTGVWTGVVNHLIR